MNNISDSVDSKIIACLQDGGVDELTRLFMRWRPRIREMIAARFDRKLLSRGDASDILQETYIRACRMLDTYLEDPKIHPIIWLRTLSKQVLFEMARKQYRAKRTPKLEQAIGDKSAKELFSESYESANTRLQRQEIAAKVNQLLKKLPITDQEIIDMRHVDVLSFQAIAKLLEIKVEAAKKRYSRALEKLRAFADNDPFFQE